MNKLHNTLETLRTYLRMLTFCELASGLILQMTKFGFDAGRSKVRERHFLDRFFKFLGLQVITLLIYICVIYRRASHAGPSASFCFARINVESIENYCQDNEKWLAHV